MGLSLSLLICVGVILVVEALRRRDTTIEMPSPCSTEWIADYGRREGRVS